MTESITYIKSEQFSVRIVKLYSYLKEKKKEFIISKQIMRSGTSIAANLAEARRAISKSDFLSKIYISLKETEETSQWLRLLKNSGFINDKQFTSISADCDELKRLLMSTTKTTSRNLRTSKLSTLNSKLCE